MPSQAFRSLTGLYTLTAILFCAFVVAASPNASPKVLSLDFHKKIPRNTPMTNRLRKRQKTVSVDIANADIAYLINMTVGTPPQPFSVQLDTGSSDIWIPSVDSDACQEVQEACQALGQYDSSASSSYELIDRDGFQIQYQDNSAIFGDYITETLMMGKTTVRNLTMGLATQATRPFGIMGIGYDAGESIASVDPALIYPNIISQLKNQGAINTLAYSLWLNDLDSLTGSILFGGIDTAKYHGDLTALPVQKSSNNTYSDFTVALSSLSVIDPAGKTAFSQDNLALPVILDSGTTISYLPDNIVNPIIGGVGAVDDPDLGLIVPCSLRASPAKFRFTFGGNGGAVIEAPLEEFVNDIYLEDGSQPTFRDGTGAVCGFGLMSSETGPILFGDTFLRSAYVVYDLSNNLIGMAQTNYNATSANVVEISSEIPNVKATATGVAVTETYTGHPQVTLAPTRNQGGQATGHGSPTFDLAASTGSSGGGETGAAVLLGPPKVEAVTIITGMVCLISTIFGSSLLFMM